MKTEVAGTDVFLGNLWGRWFVPSPDQSNRDAYKEMLRWPEKELDDIGLTRGDIEYALRLNDEAAGKYLNSCRRGETAR
ncbi:MAG: DUF1127 domain-containing protein [Hyphomicrobiaceae bacterium]